MKVSEALQQRKSVRAYLDKPVPQEVITRILNAARCAPSGTNTQPWEVAVTTGKTRDEIANKMVATFRAGGKGHMAYNYYPTEWKAPFKPRRVACGLQLYSTLGIKKEDTTRKAEQWEANYHSFGAPVVMYFLMDKIMETGSFMDYGMFIQSIMLAAVEEGLATCPQAALAEYPDIVKQTLGYDDNYIVVCGLALGYEDSSALINSYRTPREEVATFTRFFD